MHPGRSVLTRRCLIVPLALFLISAAGCGSQPGQKATPGPVGMTTATGQPAVIATAPTLAGASAPAALVTPASQPASAGPIVTAAPDQLTGWPSGSFRYEVRLKPAGQADAQETLVSGRYRAGSWQETARTGDGAPQDLIVSSGDTYTHPAGETTWTHWPGIGFDAAYGMTAPLTVLRLYPLAARSARPVLDLAPGAPEPTFRIQSLIAAATVDQLMQAGVHATVAGAEGQASLSAQLKPMAVDQTITYWRGESGRIYRASATLLAAGSDGQPAPWMEVTWRFWNYDDPQITVSAPAESRPAPDAASTDVPAPGSGAPAGNAEPISTGQAPASAPASAAAPANLAVRVFAAPGVPAQNLAVTVYPAGDAQHPVDSLNDANAQFSLPPGRYDLRVQMDYAEQWLRGLEVTADKLNNQTVTFDFGTLQLSVQRNGVRIPVDIVTYPAGDRQNWVDWRSDNPATITLRAGTYDVEIAYGDYKAKQTVAGLVIKAGVVTAKTVEVP